MQKLKNVAASEPRKLCRAGVVACDVNEIWYEEAQRGSSGYQGSKAQEWWQMPGKNMAQGEENNAIMETSSSNQCSNMDSGQISQRLNYGLQMYVLVFLIHSFLVYNNINDTSEIEGNWWGV